MKKKILVIGSGGREHALAWKLAQSSQVEKIYVAPGNAGTAMLSDKGFAQVENIDIKVDKFSDLVHFAYKEDIYFTVVGPDDPLAAGIVDVFQAKGLRIWGPSEAAAQLEASKAFAKDFMAEHNIPTACFKTFTVENNAQQIFDQALEYVQNQSLPIVIKASGLALGKGVTIAYTLEEAKTALQQIFIERVFGAAGDEVVIEEFLEGQEVSIHVFSDGKSYKLLPTAQDHKPIYDGDKGPNTGGMGTIAPLPWLNSVDLKYIEERVVKPTIEGMTKDGIPFVGLLYPGLKMTPQGPKVLEFNARFGDPETQSYMRLLKTDLFEIIEASIDGKLNSINIEWENKSAACIVLASQGYPGNYEKGLEISGIADAETNPEIVVFHAGTKLESNKILTNGGRVLGVTAIANNLENALKLAYQAADKINFQGKTFRKDIGAKAFAKI